MPMLSVELDDATVDALEVERELLGFESRSAYVRWLLAHRGTVEPDGDRTALLETYRERIAQLEAAVDAAEMDGTDGIESSQDLGSEDTDPAKGSMPNAGPAGGSATDGDEWTRSQSDPTVEVRGSPRRTVLRADSSAVEDETPDRGSTDDAETTAAPPGETAQPPREGPDASRAESAAPARIDGSTSEAGSSDGPDPTRLETAIETSNLSPERIERIREDRVAEDAGNLGTVEVDRLDEFARRAVAKTRKRLDRDVQTGLEYTASTGLEADDVRPGEDVTDLADLEVPGRSTDAIEARREAAGRAVAFLRDRGRARRSDFVEALYEAHPAGYDTPDGWWRCIKMALKQVDAVDGGEGARVWRFDR